MLVSSQYVTGLLGDGPSAGGHNTTDTLTEDPANSTAVGQETDNKVTVPQPSVYIVHDVVLLQEVTIPDVASLTAMFFVFNFLAATQDVAVDG